MAFSNGKIFNSTELPKGKPVVIIYFDPDCDHCQKMMDTLFKKINSFKKAELVLVTYKPLNELAAFEKKYNIHKYENIKAGTEGTVFYLRNYYKLIKMPFTALYDKRGNYSYSYKDQVPLNDLLSRLNKLK
jgi:thiol-disulfide isomerase/thioredoxin